MVEIKIKGYIICSQKYNCVITPLSGGKCREVFRKIVKTIDGNAVLPSTRKYV